MAQIPDMVVDVKIVRDEDVNTEFDIVEIPDGVPVVNGEPADGTEPLCSSARFTEQMVDLHDQLSGFVNAAIRAGADWEDGTEHELKIVMGRCGYGHDDEPLYEFMIKRSTTESI